VPRSRFVFDALNVPALVNELAAQALLVNQDRCTKNFYLVYDNTTAEWSRCAVLFVCAAVCVSARASALQTPPVTNSPPAPPLSGEEAAAGGSDGVIPFADAASADLAMSQDDSFWEKFLDSSAEGGGAAGGRGAAPGGAGGAAAAGGEVASAAAEGGRSNER
jgi:hypothetical protein